MRFFSHSNSCLAPATEPPRDYLCIGDRLEMASFTAWVRAVADWSSCNISTKHKEKRIQMRSSSNLSENRFCYLKNASRYYYSHSLLHTAKKWFRLYRPGCSQISRLQILWSSFVWFFSLYLSANWPPLSPGTAPPRCLNLCHQPSLAATQ